MRSSGPHFPVASFLCSLPIAGDDLFYSSLVLLFTGIALTAALLRRRLLLSLSSATLVLALLGVQYFAKLTHTVHWGLLAVGFGVMLFCLAALFERKFKHLLPELGRWD